MKFENTESTSSQKYISTVYFIMPLGVAYVYHLHRREWISSLEYFAASWEINKMFINSILEELLNAFLIPWRKRF